MNKVLNSCWIKRPIFSNILLDLYIVTYLELCFHLRDPVTVKYIWEEKYQKVKKENAGWDEVPDLKKHSCEDSFPVQMTEMSGETGKTL